MVGMGYAMMGTAIGAWRKRGDGSRPRQAISCPLLEDCRISGSRGILINITFSSQLSMQAMDQAAMVIYEAAENDDAQVIFGATLDESLGDSVKVTVIATGFHPEVFKPIGELRAEIATQIRRVEAQAAVAPVQAQQAAPPPSLPHAEPDPEMEAEPMLDLDDLDTPAYLRQGRLLN